VIYERRATAGLAGRAGLASWNDLVLETVIYGKTMPYMSWAWALARSAGATSGIGLETARVLALRGVRVVMAVRNVSAGLMAKDAIVAKTPDARIDVLELDLSSIASVRRFASEFDSLKLPLNILM
jgi:WW domain-containing oxidoreductase